MRALGRITWMVTWEAMNVSVLIQERWWFFGLQLSSCLVEENMGLSRTPRRVPELWLGSWCLYCSCCACIASKGAYVGQLTRVGLPSCRQRFCGIDLMVLSPSWLLGALKPKALAIPWEWGCLPCQRERFS